MPGLVQGKNTPQKNKRALRKLRSGESPASGKHRGADPDKQQPKGNPIFGRKGD